MHLLLGFSADACCAALNPRHCHLVRRSFRVQRHMSERPKLVRVACSAKWRRNAARRVRAVPCRRTVSVSAATSAGGGAVEVWVDWRRAGFRAAQVASGAARCWLPRGAARRRR